MFIQCTHQITLVEFVKYFIKIYLDKMNFMRIYENNDNIQRHTYTHIKWTDRQTHTYMYKHTIHTCRQTDRQTDRQIDRQIDRQTDRQTDRYSHTPLFTFRIAESLFFCWLLLVTVNVKLYVPLIKSVKISTGLVSDPLTTLPV